MICWVLCLLALRDVLSLSADPGGYWGSNGKFESLLSIVGSLGRHGGFRVWPCLYLFGLDCLGVDKD